MENSTSYTERYILVPNSVIRNIGYLGGVDTFRLYAELLLHRDWRNQTVITPNLLLKWTGRSEQYWRKRLKVQLQTLIENSILAADNSVEGLNDYSTITISLLPGPATEIKCVNVEIFNLRTSVNVNALFAVFTFVKMCTDKTVGFARVSMETVAKGLGLSDKTVEKAIKVLEENGFMSVTRGVYNTVSLKKMANKYRINDYNSLRYRAKHGLVSFSEKQILSASEEAETVIEKTISKVLTDPDKFSPCVFMGLSARLFREYYSTLNHENMFTISSLKDIADVSDEYSGILSVPDGVIILNIEKVTNGIENLIVEFLKNSVVPVVILLDDDITNNSLKSQVKCIFS